jgi:hypothetical protein
MQNTYKSLTSAKIASQMIADNSQPATYWITIQGTEYRVTAHRDTVEMANGTLASTLVLETAHGLRVVLRWSGRPTTVKSATVRS